MAGLIPAIHVLGAAGKFVDARDKPGHDGGGTFTYPAFRLAFPPGWSIRPSDPNEIRSFPADGSIATGEIVQICP